MQSMNIVEVQPTSKHTTAPGVSLQRWLRVLTALAAIVLLVWLVWKVYHIYQLSTDKIFDQTYMPYQLAAGEMSLITPIEQAYTSKNYKDAIRESKTVFSVSERERLLIGLSYMETGEYLRAISWLKRLTISSEAPLRQTAEYYLTLCYLKNDDYDNAIVQMKEILNNPSHLYHRQFRPEMIKELRLIKWK